MDHIIKKNIRLLAEKYNYNIRYEPNGLSLSKAKSNIFISQKDKYSFLLKYNISDGVLESDISNTDIYDILLELFRRVGSNEINPKTGCVLKINDWILEEGKFAEEKIEKLKKDLKAEYFDYRNLGGNRIEAEYYKGILILMDDLCINKSNLIDLKVQ